jgi:amphi-Trp domain-containing protein
MSKKQVTQQGLMATDEVIAYLESLVSSFKEGKVVVQQGEQFVSMNPPEQVSVEVEAKQKEGKEKFSLELSWRNVEQPAESEKVKISSKEPEMPAAEEQPIEGEKAESAEQEESEAPFEKSTFISS